MDFGIAKAEAALKAQPTEQPETHKCPMCGAGCNCYGDSCAHACEAQPAPATRSELVEQMLRVFYEGNTESFAVDQWLRMTAALAVAEPVIAAEALSPVTDKEWETYSAIGVRVFNKFEATPVMFRSALNNLIEARRARLGGTKGE